MKKTTKAVTALMAAAAIQGSTFPLQKMALSGVSPFIFNALRFGLAALVSFFVFGKGKANKGIILGAVLSAGYISQTWGLTLTDASKSGFIVSLYTILIPVFSYILEKERITIIQGFAFALSVAGSYLLSGGIGGFNPGDLLMIGCAISFALHIVLITKFSKQVPESDLLFPQFFTVALTNAVLGMKGKWILPLSSYLVIVYSALLATVLGIYLQLKFQKSVGSNRTGLIFLMLPISSTIFSYLILGESFSRPQWIGASIILVAMMMSSLKLRLQKEGKKA